MRTGTVKSIYRARVSPPDVSKTYGTWLTGSSQVLHNKDVLKIIFKVTPTFRLRLVIQRLRLFDLLNKWKTNLFGSWYDEGFTDDIPGGNYTRCGSM